MRFASGHNIYLLSEPSKQLLRGNIRCFGLFINAGYRGVGQATTGVLERVLGAVLFAADLVNGAVGQAQSLRVRRSAPSQRSLRFAQ